MSNSMLPPSPAGTPLPQTRRGPFPAAASAAPSVPATVSVPLPGTALLEASGLVKRYRGEQERLFRREPPILALDGVSLRLEEGESLAIVGESGSGKSTLLRLLLALERPDEGAVRFRGRPVSLVRRDRMLWFRRHTGLVLQDPYSSLDPRMTIGASVAEPLEAVGFPGNHAAIVQEMLSRVGLPEDAAERFPHTFSGGQRQRIALARALVHQPSLLVGDEPVSALDVLVRRRVLGLLAELRRELGLSMITVTHDLGLVGALSERIMVMHRGAVVEEGKTADVLAAPQHEYTKRLLLAVPTLPRFG